MVYFHPLDQTETVQELAEKGYTLGFLISWHKSKEEIEIVSEVYLQLSLLNKKVILKVGNETSCGLKLGTGPCCVMVTLGAGAPIIPEK